MVVAGPCIADFNTDATVKSAHAEGLPSSVVGLLIEPRTCDVFVASKCGVTVLVGPNEIFHMSPSPLHGDPGLNLVSTVGVGPINCCAHEQPRGPTGWELTGNPFYAVGGSPESKASWAHRRPIGASHQSADRVLLSYRRTGSGGAVSRRAFSVEALALKGREVREGTIGARPRR